MRPALLLLAILLPGCATPCGQSLDLSLAPDGVDDAAPMSIRNRVHVIVLDGAFSDAEKLREMLNANGFAKVSSGGILWEPYFELLMRREFLADPEVRFLVIGRGGGLSTARMMIAKMQNEGIPVDEAAEEAVLETAVAIATAMPQARIEYVASRPMIDNAAPRPSATAFRKPPLKATLTGNEKKK